MQILSPGYSDGDTLLMQAMWVRQEALHRQQHEFVVLCAVALVALIVGIALVIWLTRGSKSTDGAAPQTDAALLLIEQQAFFNHNNHL